jgi:hypothetical protein
MRVAARRCVFDVDINKSISDAATDRNVLVHGVRATSPASPTVFAVPDAGGGRLADDGADLSLEDGLQRVAAPLLELPLGVAARDGQLRPRLAHRVLHVRLQ